MARLYVYALAGSPVQGLEAGGRRLYSVPLNGVHAVCDEEPPDSALPDSALSEERLYEQHTIVEAIAARAEAVLPARYGALLDAHELEQVLEARRDAILQALELVRGREQMTLRMALDEASERPRQGAPATTGTEYLEARRTALAGPLPAALEPVRAAVAALVHAERRQPSRGILPAVVFHLITRGRAPEYRSIAEAVASAPVRITGPWPAFAFTPELFG